MQPEVEPSIDNVFKALFFSIWMLFVPDCRKYLICSLTDVVSIFYLGRGNKRWLRTSEQMV